MRWSATIACSLFFLFQLQAQPDFPPLQERDTSDFEAKMQSFWTSKSDSLEPLYGKNKQLPEAYKVQALAALSYYPELQDTRIEFVERKFNTTMAARPAVRSIFKRKGKRKYRIFINRSPDVEVPLDAVQFSACVGVIGHELAHILDYENKSGLRITLNGLWYWNRMFKRKFEHATDQRTIDHGLGEYLLSFSEHVLFRSKASEKYKSFKTDVYMTPEEIRIALGM